MYLLYVLKPISHEDEADPDRVQWQWGFPGHRCPDTAVSWGLVATRATSPHSRRPEYHYKEKCLSGVGCQFTKVLWIISFPYALIVWSLLVRCHRPGFLRTQFDIKWLMCDSKNRRTNTVIATQRQQPYEILSQWTHFSLNEQLKESCVDTWECLRLHMSSLCLCVGWGWWVTPGWGNRLWSTDSCQATSVR